MRDIAGLEGEDFVVVGLLVDGESHRHIGVGVRTTRGGIANKNQPPTGDPHLLGVAQSLKAKIGCATIVIT